MSPSTTSLAESVPVPRDGPPPDHAARDLIREALDVNILVEAGAGSGKTAALVERLLAYVEKGVPVESLAAVTFTRKAAAELRERFQGVLEARVRESRAQAAVGDAEAAASAGTWERALSGLDGAFLGTIHSFCARLLREDPIAAGLDPAFEEVTEAGWRKLRADFWRRWLDERLLADDETIRELRELDVHPTRLNEAFADRTTYPDVEFSAGEVPEPDVAPVRAALERLLDRALKLLPVEEPPGGWDVLQSRCRRLRFLRSEPGWGELLGFVSALEELCASAVKVVQKRWSDERDIKKVVKQLGEDFEAFVEGPASQLLTAWREHRYAPVMRFLDAAMAAFEQERLDAGRLGFEDLLLRASDLLRRDRTARRRLGERYAHLLVDEFQDTDPIQAEVCFLLASDPESGDDWQTVTLRPGALFVVGDPKQSIYRFRRASFDTYGMVKERFRQCGEVLELKACFRCAPAITRFVESHFVATLPAVDSEEQAAFAPMVSWGKAAALAGSVWHYTISAEARPSQTPELLDDARVLASWIAERVNAGESAVRFLVLTHRKAHTRDVVRELGERNVPVSLTGGEFEEGNEIAELLVVLRALADPDNAVLVAAALEGWCFGLSPLDLLHGRDAGIEFSVTRPPASVETAAGRALGVMHRWWLATREWSIEDVVERILDETGLLGYAASSPIGESRSGVLVRLVALVREASSSASGLPGLLVAVEEVLRDSEGSAQLRPERQDAVRVMNLHKAKGLEADIVVLAAPVNLKDHQLRVHVARSGGEARSGLLILEDGKVIAQPPGWAEMAETEKRFQSAEEERLRYVAATRARAELVVARLERSPTKKGEARESKALWKPFDRALLECGTGLEGAAREAPGRRLLARTADELRARLDGVTDSRAAAGRATVSRTSVTRSAKAEHAENRAEDVAWASGPREQKVQGRGKAWGSAVHRVIEGLGRGRRGDNLRAFARAVAAAEGLAAAAEVERIANELVEVAERVWASGAGEVLEGAASRRFEWALTVTDTGADGVQRLTEGVIDAAAFNGQTWQVLDWKTDDVDAATWTERSVAYQAQVDRYAAIIAKLRGGPAKGTLRRTVASP